MMAALSRTTRKRALSLAKESAVESHIVTVTAPKTAIPQRSIASSASVLPTKLTVTVTSTPWTNVTMPRTELDLSTTLKCGQSFRWHRQHRELPSGQISLPTWSCVLDHRLWEIQETEDGFRYRTFRPSVSEFSHTQSGLGSKERLGQEQQQDQQDLDKEFLRDYLQLNVPLTELYVKWSKTDANFRSKAPLFPGVRILRQDPVENLICFICSSNNNISRISQMASL
jgi:N-glycosylase/DNA lyase